MSDLTEWLRQEAELAEYEGCDVSAANYKKAADEIERLQAVVDWAMESNPDAYEKFVAALEDK